MEPHTSRGIRYLTTLAAALAFAVPVGQASAHDAASSAMVAHTDSRMLDAGIETRAAAAPSVWCGERRATDNTADERDNGQFRYHGIYAVPSDGTDRFAQFAQTLQSDALQASALLERLYGRAIRYDMGTRCGPDFLDISVIRLPHTRAELTAAAASPVGLLTLLVGDLAAAGFDPLPMRGVLGPEALARAKNYLVWMDDVDVRPQCGVGSTVTDTRRDAANINNLGGKLSLIFRDGDRFCGSNTVRHEIGHNLGAVVAEAPHVADGSHCGDAYEDTMCLPSAPRRAGGSYQSEYFDYGNDDYWDPPGGSLPWWTVNLSRFLCAEATCNTPQLGSVLAPLLHSLAGVADQLLPATCLDLALIIVGGPCSSAVAVATRTLAPGAAPRLMFRTRRGARNRWRVSLEVRNVARTVATVTCLRRGRRVRVLRKRLVARTQARATVTCSVKPRASARTV